VISGIEVVDLVRAVAHFATHVLITALLLVVLAVLKGNAGRLMALTGQPSWYFLSFRVSYNTVLGGMFWSGSHFVKFVDSPVLQDAVRVSPLTFRMIHLRFALISGCVLMSDKNNSEKPDFSAFLITFR